MNIIENVAEENSLLGTLEITLVITHQIYDHCYLSRKNQHSTNSEYFVEMNSYLKLLLFKSIGNFVKKEFLYLIRIESGDNQWSRTNRPKKLFVSGIEEV